MSMFNVADKKEVLNKYFQKKLEKTERRRRRWDIFLLSSAVGIFLAMCVIVILITYQSSISTSYKMVDIFLTIILMSNVLSKFFVYALK